MYYAIGFGFICAAFVVVMLLLRAPRLEYLDEGMRCFALVVQVDNRNVGLENGVYLVGRHEDAVGFAIGTLVKSGQASVDTQGMISIDGDPKQYGSRERALTHWQNRYLRPRESFNVLEVRELVQGPSVYYSPNGENSQRNVA